MKKTIVLIGFFGRGNCGDEAMLQCQYEFFMNHGFEVSIIVNGRGAYTGFWDWYPYNEARSIIESDNLSWFVQAAKKKELAGVHIGGGGLDFGFRADFVFNALRYEIPTFLTGVELSERIDHGTTDDATEKYLDLFSMSADRYFDEKIRHEIISQIRPICTQRMMLGSDWAFDLISDEYEGIGYAKNRVLLTVREHEYNKIQDIYLNFLKMNVETLRLLGLDPIFLPFAPEDTRFLEYFNLDGLAPIVELWNNPRRMQQYIKNSKMIISYGRFHPMIFAANVGTSVASVDLTNFGIPAYQFLKTHILAKMLDIAILSNQEQFLNWVHEPKPVNLDKVTVAKNRLKEMQNSILQYIK